ncbi:hypothetical protein [Mycobacterium phage WXIN]|nr:hypothetical protein [Mycobacterium phage WXIN]
MFETFVLNLLKEAAKDEDVQKFVADQAARLADHLKKNLLPDILSTFPAFGAALLKTVLESPESVVDIAKEAVGKVTKDDPDFPIVSDIFDLSEAVAKWLKP